MRFAKFASWTAVACLLSACAGMQSALSPPEVKLTNVSLGAVDFSKQTFVLHFDVQNPNAFTLPINYVSYGVKLNKQQFASGETVAEFKVPANSVSAFAISVDLDLLRTAPQLLYTVRDGVNGTLDYELSGKLGIDLPLMDRIAFRSNGEVRLNADDIHNRKSQD